MPTSSVTILSYHRIATPGNSDLADTLIDAYPPDFEAQMQHISSRYTVVSAWDVVRCMQEGFSLPKKAMLITFDDGYRCFMETATPVLRRFGFPATLFVATHVAGSECTLFWWDELHRALCRTELSEVAVPGLDIFPLGTPEQRETAFGSIVTFFERLEDEAADRMLQSILLQCNVCANEERYLLNWEELRALEAEGVAIGPHTRHHPILSQVSTGRVHAETRGSWRDLSARLSAPLPIFCYPNGRAHAVSTLAVEAVKSAGLLGGVITDPGINRIGKTDPYRLMRIGGSAGESLRHFSIKISPSGRVYRRLKQLLRRDHAQDGGH